MLLSTNLTKEYLFRNYSQELIFTKLGVPVDYKLFKSKIRQDKTETCCFYWKDGILYLKDFAGYFYGSCIDLCMHLNNCSYTTALQIIHNLLIRDNTQLITLEEYNKTKSLEKEKKTIKVKTKEFTLEDLAYWQKYKISIETLNRFSVKSVDKCWVNDIQLKEPGELCFVYQYVDKSVKLYFPCRKKYRFITNSNIIQGISQLDNPEFIVWTTSYKDIMTFSNYNIQALSMGGESILPKIPDNLKHLPHFYNADADFAGLRAAVKVKNKLNIPIIVFPKELYKIGCKDFSDSITILEEKVIIELIENLKNKFLVKELKDN